MSLVLTGRLVPITTRTSVAKSESASFRGRVWIADDGTIAAVTTTRKRSLPGFESAMLGLYRALADRGPLTAAPPSGSRLLLRAGPVGGAGR